MKFSERLSLRAVVSITTIAVLGLSITMLTTTPDNLGPFGITLWFIGVLIASGGTLTILIYFFRRAISRRLDASQVFATALRHGVLVSTWLTALLALNSLRQLGLKDIVLVSLLIVLIEFYLRRTR